MSFDLDDEILQDFLVEATEILDKLGEQLVDLERSPQDTDLLNAIFRGFHTVKGGAGFLNIDALVDICHVAEDVFNLLRQGQWQVDADLMDVVLQAYDAVNRMMAEVSDGQAPQAADPQLVQALRQYVQTPQPQNKVAMTPTAVAPSQSSPETLSGGEEIAEEEFDALLDKLYEEKGSKTQVTETSSPEEVSGDSSDSITDDEFEALLDELHGPGSVSTAKTNVAEPKNIPVSQPEPEVEVRAAEVRAAKATSSDLVPKRGDAATARSDPMQALMKNGTKPAMGDTTVRVDTQRLDEIMNMVGELVLVRNRLSTLKSTLVDEELTNAVSNLDVVTADLQLSVMKTRMQPVKKVFGRFPRVVRDLARNLKKEVDLELRGEDTDLDKNLVEALADPMVHLVRNAVDHGIEAPAEREKIGKPRRGRVILAAAQEGDHILLSIEDDGKGMDPEILRRKAVEKGLMDEEAAARLDDQDCFNLIFQPGFSTNTEVSDVSGRGVGMDVVKTRISQMNGTVEVDSRLELGSKIVIKLPLTLAILPTLMVILGAQPFALPLASVVEIFNLDLNRTNTVDGQLTIRVRDRALPLFYLRRWLVQQHSNGNEEASGHVVVVNVGGVQVGLVVDYLVGQEEVVIKPLGALLQGMEGMAGATITGDGKIALILDVPGLMRRYARK